MSSLEDRQQLRTAGADTEQDSQSQRPPQKPRAKKITQGPRPLEEKVVLEFQSSAFTNMAIRFSNGDNDIKNELKIAQDPARFSLSSRPRGASRIVRHVISFRISLPHGQVQVKETVSELSNQSLWSDMTRTIVMDSEDLYFSRPVQNIADSFIISMALKPGKHFHTGCFSHGQGVLSAERSKLMFLKAYEGMLSEMRDFEVQIPRHEESLSVVESLFETLQKALSEMASSAYSLTKRPGSVNSNPNSNLDATQADLIVSTDTRRTGGADFGRDFMELPPDEKMNKIHEKIRDHVKDQEQLTECESMIKEFERAVELDDAVGSLGNGNVTSQISRMTKEEVPHEMLDLFLMMGRLRVQKRKDGMKKKRKWDITGF